jgi:hypothetical protein
MAFDSSYIIRLVTKLNVQNGLPDYANQSKWGLEIGSFAVLHLDNHTALHLEITHYI